MSIKNDGHYFCRAGGNRPDGLNEPVTLDLQAWAYFKDRVREEGMTYKACESWMSTEASALYKSPKQEWSFLDSTSVGENDKSQPD
ncbi:hypothetical protein ACUTGA_21890 [Escherichia coli]